MNVIATTSDQVLLAVLYAVRDEHPEVPVAAVVEAYVKFQAATGAIIYGSPLNHTEGFVAQDLGADVGSLMERMMLKEEVWKECNLLAITLIGLPVASTFRLVEPFDCIPGFLHEAMARRDH